MPGSLQIVSTRFGEITIGENAYQKDIYILVSGAVKKRKKSLAKEAYGTSHKIGPAELKQVCKGHPRWVFIGSGQSGLCELTEEGREYLEEHGVKYQVIPTPDMAESFNRCKELKAALIHVTC
jgi:hypothetical protein